MKMVIDFLQNGYLVDFHDGEWESKSFDELDFTQRLNVLHCLPIVLQNLKQEHSNMI